jgi:hypothetical protein
VDSGGEATLRDVSRNRPRAGNFRLALSVQQRSCLCLGGDSEKWGLSVSLRSSLQATSGKAAERELPKTAQLEGSFQRWCWLCAKAYYRASAGLSSGVPGESGAMAQQVAHLLCKQGVRGSSPLGSTYFPLSGRLSALLRDMNLRHLQQQTAAVPLETSPRAWLFFATSLAFDRQRGAHHPSASTVLDGATCE